jgi:hypothetical protein
MVIGMIYYADPVMGTEWKKLSKVDTKKFAASMSKITPVLFILALITSFAVAYFTALFHSYFKVSWFGAGIETALLLWFGACFTTILVRDVTELKSYRHSTILIGNRLLSLLAMGAIIGWLHP